MGRGGFFALDSLRGVYIVVVASEFLRRELLRGALEYCGALVTIVESAQAAFRVMEQICPDVLLLRLSEVDALELARKVRELCEGPGRSVHIVAIGSETLAADMPSGVLDAAVAEPLDPWALCRVLSGLTQTG
jgi:CheY-like chemotaxis protein